jgi:hypothetical protein
MGNNRLDHRYNAKRVCLEHAFDSLPRSGFERRKLADTGIVDENISAAEGGYGLV